MKPKIMVIGLDCATFDLIKPYVEQGWLPNLQRLMGEGVYRVLKSTVPPISPAAWTSFLTGKNPGRHGVFQFVDMDVRNYGFRSNRLINSSSFAGRTFIDHISNASLKVGTVKIPFTYPPWKVNGFMVSGEPSPEWKKAHTYPPALSAKIGRVNLGSSLDFMRYDTEDLLKHLSFDCDVRTRIACQMMEKDTYDFFMIVHNITDGATHKFWKFTDPMCPNYNKQFIKYGNIIRDIYHEADQSVGSILEKTDKDTIVLLMSDHGASRKPIHLFNINAWLKELGYLHLKDYKSSANFLYHTLKRIKDYLPPKLRSILVHSIQMHLLNRLPTFQPGIANFAWDKTKAYALELYPRYGAIALNLKDRQPNGTVNPGSEAEHLCHEIESALLELSDDRNGKKVIE
ncbi:MAG: alkaline phosphatase family protein, partial [Candidatus Hodarchaeota archaeon]